MVSPNRTPLEYPACNNGKAKHEPAGPSHNPQSSLEVEGSLVYPNSFLHGVILDVQTQRPVSNVRVHHYDGQAMCHSRSDQSGQYYLDGVQPGYHHIQTLREGYHAMEVFHTFLPNGDNRLDLWIAPLSCLVR